MTRKICAVVIVILYLVIFASKVSAEEVNTTNVQTTTEATTKLKQQMQLVQEQKKAAVNTIKNEAKAQIQAKREEFKTQMQAIKDQRKKALVERIDAKIAEVNKNQTLKFSEILTRLQGFLDKISKLTTDPNVLPNISAAQTSINAAKSAVDTQALKVYTMVITDDVTLKQNAGAIVSQFRQELTAVHKLVMDSKQTVQNLYINKALIKKEATNSAGL